MQCFCEEVSSSVGFRWNHRAIDSRANFSRSEIESWSTFWGEQAKKKGKGERPERWEIVKFLPRRAVCVCVCVSMLQSFSPYRRRARVYETMKNSSFFPSERDSFSVQSHIALEYSHFLRVFNSTPKNKKKQLFSRVRHIRVLALLCCTVLCVCEWKGDLMLTLSSYTASFARRNSGTFKCAMCL